MWLQRTNDITSDTLICKIIFYLRGPHVEQAELEVRERERETGCLQIIDVYKWSSKAMLLSETQT
jgi:hypothetical protein